MTTNLSNPYAPPRANLESAPCDSEAAVVRRAHLNHEASIKAVGTLYLLGAAGLIIVAISGAAWQKSLSLPLALLFATLLAGLGGLQLWVGFGLRKLRPWTKIPAGIMSGLGLVSFPIGTLINGYILYLLFSKKGRMVLSEPYQEIIAATPDIKYKTSILVWILLALVVALAAFVLVKTWLK
jgi:hypothetical protein